MSTRIRAGFAGGTLTITEAEPPFAAMVQALKERSIAASVRAMKDAEPHRWGFTRGGLGIVLNHAVLAGLAGDLDRVEYVEARLIEADVYKRTMSRTAMLDPQFTTPAAPAATLPSQETSVKYAIKSSSPTPRFLSSSASLTSKQSWSPNIDDALLFGSIREATRSIAQSAEVSGHVTRAGYDIVKVRESVPSRSVRSVDAPLKVGERRVGYVAQFRSSMTGYVLTAATDGAAYNFGPSKYDDSSASSSKINISADINGAALTLATVAAAHKSYTPTGILQLVETGTERTYEVLA
jgi:hypothetical protein